MFDLSYELKGETEQTFTEHWVFSDYFAFTVVMGLNSRKKGSEISGLIQNSVKYGVITLYDDKNLWLLLLKNLLTHTIL